jgi:hypothetical protein
MANEDHWSTIEAEARGAFREFPLRAYSELMPPPYVGVKPYRPALASGAATCGASAPCSLDIDEYEQAHDVEPGLQRIADRIVAELGKLVRGEAHALSKTLLAGNPAWPDELAAAAHAGRFASAPLVVACPLALSRTQDDKGNERWTLFGASHDGAAKPFWHGLDPARLAELVAWAGVTGDRWRVHGDVPEAHRARAFAGGSLAGIDALVTFVPFARLDPSIRAAYLTGALQLVPHPASLVFFEHPRYRELARELPRATQIPLLHVFPRVETSCAIRIPQSGWLDEDDPAMHGKHGHKVVNHVVRTHRWQRVWRDADIHGDGAYTDRVSVALFSTDPDVLGLYDKPLARNVQIWTEDYALLLDGSRCDRKQLAHAAGTVDRGGRFGYRMYYPPMRAGARELFWHVPVIARAAPASPAPEAIDRSGAATPRPTAEHCERFAGSTGYITAEHVDGGAPSLELAPLLLTRPAHRIAATHFEKDPGHARHTASHNARKLLDFRELLGAPLEPSLARALIHVAKDTTLDAWLDKLSHLAFDRDGGTRLANELRAGLGGEPDPGAPRVIDRLATRAFEEQIWSTIAHLAHGEFRQKDNADFIRANRGKHGGPNAKRAGVHVHERRDLEALGDHLHARYRELIAKHDMVGRAESLDHAFRWDGDFEFPWMDGWTRNRDAARERNIVMIIPGRDRGEAIVMGDHYDTAYMEDVYDAEAGGDGLRAAACGADDNHSATTALLLAAEQLLPLARDGKLARDVWLVHLTGEEFPADCMGARALCRGLVEGKLAFTCPHTQRVHDVSNVHVRGAFVLDMIGHNSDRDRDVFQIAPGEGVGSARLARRAHLANLRWNQLAAERNRAPDRAHAGRAARTADPQTPPPAFAHLPLHGDVRTEWEPRSALYNTDGQIFSDIGVPVVLFMENYDISRKGYHDTHDTMENIDLDYCAALTAIAIETVADCACAETP